MNNWPLVRLDECCDVVGGSTPSTTNDSFWHGDIQWITPKDLSQLDGHRIRCTERAITKVGLRACSARVVPPGTVVLSSRAPIGYVAMTLEPMTTSQGC